MGYSTYKNFSLGIKKEEQKRKKRKGKYREETRGAQTRGCKCVNMKQQRATMTCVVRRAETTTERTGNKGEEKQTAREAASVTLQWCEGFLWAV